MLGPRSVCFVRSSWPPARGQEATLPVRTVVAWQCSVACLTPSLVEVGPFHHSVRVRILGYYMLNVAFTCVLWCVLQASFFTLAAPSV